MEADIKEFMQGHKYDSLGEEEIVKEAIEQFLEWRGKKRQSRVPLLQGQSEARLKELVDRIGAEYRLHDSVWDD